MNPSKIKLKYRLLTKLLISHTLLASIPIIITGLVLVQTAQLYIKNIIQDRNLEFVKKASQNISSILNQAKTVLEFNAENILNLQENRLTREVIINNIVNKFNIFNEIYILDLTGRIIISTHYIADSSVYKNSNLLDAIKTDNRYDSDIYISREMLPTMDFAVPITIYNEIEEILFAKINLKEMWDVMDSLVVGQSGEGLMIDSKGNYIAHSERKKVYLNEKYPHIEIIEEIEKNKIGHTVITYQDSTQMIASYASIPNKNWGVIIQQPIEEAFAQINTMKIQVLIFVITSIIIALLIAYYFFRERIVSPVNELLSGIHRFSAGELKYRIPRIGKDEISSLAIQFNRMAKKLQRIQNKLKRTERFETLNKISSILSHEIKNPLNAMVINLQILRNEIFKEKYDRQKVENYYTIISSEIKRVDKLVNDFLILARPPKMNEHKLIIQDVLHELIFEQKGDAEKRNIKLYHIFKQEPIELFGNSDRLKQAFLNIYLNAVYAIKENGIITISLDLDEYSSDTKYVKISFKDTGEGIEKTNVKHIFDFYYTTKKGGTGLGLAVTQQIIEDYDGVIEVETDKGVGTTFNISLPVE